MRLALIQMNSRAAARDENVGRACEFVAEAARQKPDIVVLPEFFNNEYFPQYRDSRYMDYAEADDGYTQTRMKAEGGVTASTSFQPFSRSIARACTTTPPC
jgi:predicted amidohydrolase